MEIKTYKVTIVYGEEDNQSQLYILSSLDEEDAKTEGIATFIRDFPDEEILGIDIEESDDEKCQEEDTHGECYGEKEELEDMFEKDF